MRSSSGFFRHNIAVYSSAGATWQVEEIHARGHNTVKMETTISLVTPNSSSFSWTVAHRDITLIKKSSDVVLRGTYGGQYRASWNCRSRPCAAAVRLELRPFLHDRQVRPHPRADWRHFLLPYPPILASIRPSSMKTIKGAISLNDPMFCYKGKVWTLSI